VTIEEVLEDLAGCVLVEEVDRHEAGPLIP